MIDLTKVKVEGSNPEVLTWPQTSTITEFWIRPSVMHIRYTKQGQWPGVDMGGALQEATVWVFCNINGQWVATGAERLRPNQTDKPESTNPAETIGVSWLYDRNRWPLLANYQPKVGELVGFMVAAGSTRSAFDAPVRERTDVIMAHFAGDRFELASVPDVPAPAQTPTDVPVVVVPSTTIDAAVLVAAVGEFTKKLDALNLKVDTLMAMKTPTPPTYVGSLFGYTLTLKPTS